MRAISKGQLEGFPAPEELKTIYVEHDIQGEEATRTPIAYITMANPEVSRLFLAIEGNWVEGGWAVALTLGVAYDFVHP